MSSFFYLANNSPPPVFTTQLQVSLNPSYSKPLKPLRYRIVVRASNAKSAQQKCPPKQATAVKSQPAMHLTRTEHQNRPTPPSYRRQRRSQCNL
jgi:hypothetical protein